VKVSLGFDCGPSRVEQKSAAVGGLPTFAKLVTNGQDVELAVFYRYPLSAIILYTWQHVLPRLANTAERALSCAS
jgi:hypothetical protein